MRYVLMDHHPHQFDDLQVPFPLTFDNRGHDELVTDHWPEEPQLPHHNPGHVLQATAHPQDTSGFTFSFNDTFYVPPANTDLIQPGRPNGIYDQALGEPAATASMPADSPPQPVSSATSPRGADVDDHEDDLDSGDSPGSGDSKPSRKTREEFSTGDIQKLLSAVLEVNPYLCSRNEAQKKWGEVKDKLLTANACIGRDWQTLRNKVSGLLKWVEVSAY